MALLTTDIVWLEARAVTLPDGSSAQALVPTLYLRRPLEGDLRPEGALIAAGHIELRTPGELVNSGAIVAHGEKDGEGGQLTLQAGSLTHGGTLAGRAIEVQAQERLNIAGGQVLGLGQDSSVHLSARDIVLRTTAHTTHARIEGPNGASVGSATGADRIATVMEIGRAHV